MKRVWEEKEVEVEKGELRAVSTTVLDGESSRSISMLVLRTSVSVPSEGRLLLERRK